MTESGNTWRWWRCEIRDVSCLNIVIACQLSFLSEWLCSNRPVSLMQQRMLHFFYLSLHHSACMENCSCHWTMLVLWTKSKNEPLCTSHTSYLHWFHPAGKWGDSHSHVLWSQVSSLCLPHWEPNHITGSWVSNLRMLSHKSDSAKSSVERHTHWLRYMTQHNTLMAEAGMLSGVLNHRRHGNYDDIRIMFHTFCYCILGCLHLALSHS